MNEKRSPLSARMPKTPRHQAAQALMLMALTLFAAASLAALRGQEPFATWYYPFAWISYILFVDGWVFRRRGESLLLSHPGRFLFLAAWSVALWLIFEAFNLRLENWSYFDLPGNRPLRWAGYFLAFATVVPGILETADLIDASNLVKETRVKPLGWRNRAGVWFAAAGAAMLLLSLLWPRFFFPLVWGGFFFLLEPVNERTGAASILADWRAGRARRFVILILAGLACGVLWEWWNAWARARWAYSVPGVGDSKLFAMPLLGYLGFPPFALEVFAMTAAVGTLWDRSPRSVRVLLAAAAFAFSLLMCWAVDGATVRSFQ